MQSSSGPARTDTLTAASATAQSSSTLSVAIGDRIAQGIGADPVTSSSNTRLAAPSQHVSYTNSTSIFPSATSITNNTSTGNHTCIDSACGIACSSSWASWSTASSRWLNSFATTSTSTVLYYDASYTEVPIATSNGTLYATCDGIPRFSGALDYATTTNVSVPATSSTWYIIETASATANFSDPKPTCAIGSDQCGDLVSEWHASHYLAFPFNQSTGFYDYWPGGPPADFPHCNTTGGDYTEWLNDTFLSDGSGCWVKGASARLFYWPEPIQENNHSCPNGIWTVPPQAATNATALVTKVVTLSETYYNCCTKTVTMTSPTM